MKDHLMETLSAFTDGEAVDAATLAESLAAADAREVLLDFALIRTMAATDATQSSSEPADILGDERVPEGVPRRLTPRRIALAAAAVFLIGLGVALGVWLEGGKAVPRGGPTAMPAATREVKFTEGVDWFHQS